MTPNTAHPTPRVLASGDVTGLRARDILQYRDGPGPYFLELHALRAPVGHYRPDITDTVYQAMVDDAITAFQEAYGVELYQLGRSGRHLCIDDTPDHRRRYRTLRRHAIAAALHLWATMREPVGSR